MEGGKGVGEKNGTNDVVLQILVGEERTSYNNETRDLNLHLTELQSLRVSGSSSPEIPRLSRTPPPGKPRKIPTEPTSLQAPFSRSVFSKPKSRFVEPFPQLKSIANASNVASPSSKIAGTKPRDALRSASITPRTPLVDGGEEDDDEEVYKTAKLKVCAKSGKKIKKLALIELVAFVCIVLFLIAGITVPTLENKMYLGLGLWKWCVLVLVVLCGRLVTEWFINVLVFVIELNFLLKKNVLYFVYGLKRSVQIFIWLGLVLLAWGLLFDNEGKRSSKTSRILGYVTRGLASCLIGAAIWLGKNLFVKVVASSFQCNRFFDRIQESIFHQYVLRTLSGPPLMEMAERIGRAPSSGRLSFKNLKGGKREGNEGAKEEVIDVEKLKKMNQEKISAWTLKGLINVVRSTGLSTISDSLESLDDEECEQKGKEITSEWEAKAVAYDIFLNVAKSNKYIEEDDLLRFMKKEEVDIVLPLFEGAAETGKIKRKALKNWLVNVYLERKSLAHSLNDTKTAIEELNRLASGFLLLVIIIVWLLVMGFFTTNMLVFIASQLLTLAFVFGNTAKTVFEAIIFVFVMHPFDVGDRCVVDGVQLIVEEMNILTTVFLRSDNEKVFYPNSVLASKPISNFYRSPEMGDSVDFTIDVSTKVETIVALKARIKEYLDSKTQHWRPAHSVVVKDIEDVNKMKMALYVTHTINFQNYGDKTSRRSDLIFELKKIFEDLGIKYHLLPQEVHLRYVGSSAAELPPTWRYIEEDDLLCFMKKEEVDIVLPLFEGVAETGKIKRKALKNWLVNVYLERKSLARSLNDTKTAIEKLNRLASGVLLLVIIIVWLLLVGFLTTNILVFISSQILLVVFVFGNTAKTVDVGDRCVVEGVRLIVEERNILTTVFLRSDNEKVFYPNSVLASKPISNFYRSPEMGDSVDFTIDASTTVETIVALKARIKEYLDSKTALASWP